LGLLSNLICIRPYFDEASRSKNTNKPKLPYINTYSNLLERNEYRLERILELEAGSIKTKIDNNSDNKIVILITDKFQLGSIFFVNV
jgi:hypothetical protein